MNRHRAGRGQPTGLIGHTGSVAVDVLIDPAVLHHIGKDDLAVEICRSLENDIAAWIDRNTATTGGRRGDHRNVDHAQVTVVDTAVFVGRYWLTSEVILQQERGRNDDRSIFGRNRNISRIET